MRRILPVFIILQVIICTLSLNAFEGGGVFSTFLNFDIASPQKQSNPTYFSTSNRLALWMKQNIDNEGFYNFSIQGSAYFKLRKLIVPRGTPLEIKPCLDVDSCKFSFFFPLKQKGSLMLDIGRRGVVDSTGIIVSQPFDGAFLKYKTPRLEILQALAFTTLLNANTVALNEPLKPTSNPIYSLPKSYASLMTFIHVPISKTSYSLDFDALGFFETKKLAKLKFYLTSALKGPIIRRLFFSLSASGSFIRNASLWTQGLQTTGALAYYFQKYSAKLALNIQYATADRYAFQTFTMRNISSQFFSPYTNVWSTGIRYSIKPIPTLYLQAVSNVICKGKVQNGTLYRGFEWMTSANYTLKRDINFEASLGQFIKRDASMQTFFTLKGMIAF